MGNPLKNSSFLKSPVLSGGFKKLFWLKNKYLLSGCLFMVWMFFFDPKDWGIAYDKHEKLNELQQNELHLTKVILQTKDELAQLKTNAQTIEKYAREKYFMKKDNEDLFIVSSTFNIK